MKVMKRVESVIKIIIPEGEAFCLFQELLDLPFTRETHPVVGALYAELKKLDLKKHDE